MWQHHFTGGETEAEATIPAHHCPAKQWDLGPLETVALTSHCPLSPHSPGTMLQAACLAVGGDT